MTDENIRAEIDRLAEEGGRALKDASFALPKLEAARTLAIAAGDSQTAALLSQLMARSASFSGRYARAIALARRGTGDAPQESGPFYTLASIYEYAASRRAERVSRRRAAVLYEAAGDAYATASRCATKRDEQQQLARFSDRARARAAQLKNSISPTKQ